MKKSIVTFVSSILFLSACATAPEGVTVKEFADKAELQVNYDSVKMTGETIRPDVVGSKRGLVFYSANIVAIIPNEADQAATSTVNMSLRYFDEQVIYKHVSIEEEERKELIPTTILKRDCNESCQYVQDVSFPVETAKLLAKKDDGLAFRITERSDKTGISFVIPANYIQGLILASGQKKATNVSNVNGAIVEKQSLLKMSQDLFAKASSAEKEQFTEWAFKNRKSIESPLNGEGKILPMLEYWYEKATEAEKAEILTWVLAQ